MFNHDVMNYKRHNQGHRAHVRRKYYGGYWQPKYIRDLGDQKHSKRFRHSSILCECADEKEKGFDGEQSEESKERT